MSIASLLVRWNGGRQGISYSLQAFPLAFYCVDVGLEVLNIRFI